MHLVDDQAPQQDQGDGEPLAPIVHMINFKTRRVLMCRGDKPKQDALGRGFKVVSVNHFVNYVDGAQKGFRRKKKQKGSKRK